MWLCKSKDTPDITQSHPTDRCSLSLHFRAEERLICLTGTLWKELCKSKKACSCYSSQWISMVALLRNRNCDGFIMLFISSTWDVCTHRHDIIPLGAANRFVWPGSLYCVSLYTHALVPSPTPLVPKPDIKKGLPKNNMGNFLPSWELSPCWEDSTLLPPASYLPSLSLCVCSLPAEIWRGDNNSSGGWRGEFSGEVQVYFFLSASLIPSVVCQQRFGGQQQQQWVISKGGGTEVWLPSEPLSAKKEEGKKKEGEDEGQRGGNGVADRGKIWEVERGERLQTEETVNQDKPSVQLYLHARTEFEVLLEIGEGHKSLALKN